MKSRERLSLPPGGQTAKFLHDLFPQLPNPFKGVVRIGAMPGLGPTLSVAGLRSLYFFKSDGTAWPLTLN